VASTELPTDDDACYPVDDITENKNDELHVKVVNISMKVEVSFVLPPRPRPTYHCSLVPYVYVHAGVDEVMTDLSS
jgi:hypothetical protein